MSRVCCGCCSPDLKFTVEENYELNMDYIKAEKEKFREKWEAGGEGEPSEGAFISTNDIITSWWFSMHQSDKRCFMFEMAVDARNRFEEVTI